MNDGQPDMTMKKRARRFTKEEIDVIWHIYDYQLSKKQNPKKKWPPNVAKKVGIAFGVPPGRIRTFLHHNLPIRNLAQKIKVKKSIILPKVG